jgi:SAM-dependent methyltransferase
MSYPLNLNLGCGAKFRENFLNLDIDPEFRPDIVFDLNQPLLLRGTRQFSTDRFGDIVLHANSFESIIALDVLEHIVNLTTAMSSCLELLRMGGLMHIFVPYDLSLGAWQDPSHVRAFNENSWQYYCEWFWRLGWRRARFALQDYAMILSPYGEELRARGLTPLELARTPRAVEHMRVILKKVRLSAEDRQTLRDCRPGLNPDMA